MECRRWRKCPSAMGKPQLRSPYAGVDRLQQRRWSGGAAQCNLPGRLGKVPRDSVVDPAMERCSLRPRHWAARTPQRSRTACESRARRPPHLVRGRRVRALPDGRGGGNRPQPSPPGTRIRVGRIRCGSSQTDDVIYMECELPLSPARFTREGGRYRPRACRESGGRTSGPGMEGKNRCRRGGERIVHCAPASAKCNGQ